MSLRTLSQLILPQFRKPSRCEACGEMFTCGAGLTGCWCAEIELSEAARAGLRERYSNCLCRACLERFASEDASAQGQAPERAKVE